MSQSKMEQTQVQKSNKPGANCLLYHIILFSLKRSCRISGSATCLGIAAYTYSIYRKTPITKVGDRRFSFIMSLGFAALGIYRGLIY